MAGPSPNWSKRVGWLILIWVISVASLGLVALAFRFLMNLAGLTV